MGTTPSSSRTSFLVRTHVAADVGELPNSVGAPRTGGEAPRAASCGGPGLGALGPLSRGCSVRPVTSCSSRLSLRHISLTLPATFRGRNSTRADYEYQHSNLYAISGRWGHSGRVRAPLPLCASPAFFRLSMASALPLCFLLCKGPVPGRGQASPSLSVSEALREGPNTQRVLKLTIKDSAVGFTGSKGGFQRTVPASFTRQAGAGFPGDAGAAPS